MASTTTTTTTTTSTTEPPDSMSWGEENPTDPVVVLPWRDEWAHEDSPAITNPHFEVIDSEWGSSMWGELRVFPYEPAYSLVKVLSPGGNLLTVDVNRYGNNYDGHVKVSIRGDVSIFTQFAASPAWNKYVNAIDKAWEFVQLKVEMDMSTTTTSTTTTSTT